MENWNADHLRVTLFALGPWAAPTQLLGAIFNVDVESSSERGFGAEATAEGQWEEARVEIRRNVNRLDIFVKALDAGMTPDASLPGKFNLLDSLVSRVVSWLKNSDFKIIRAAVSTQALLPMPSREDAYEKLGSMVRCLQVRPKEFRDLNFQLNIPKFSNFDSSLSINRISAWAVAVHKLLSIDAMIGAAAVNNSAFEHHFLTVAIDVNTDGARVENFDNSEMQSLFNEMQSELILILEKGID